MANKLSAFVAGVLALIILGGGAWLWYNYQKPTEMPSPDEAIVKYELQTHEYFSDAPATTKYHIKTVKDLNDFYSLYSNQLAAKTEYLEHNDLFIEVRVANSGSIKHTLDAVNFDNNTVNFEISTTSPEIGTDDMAFWYFVAVIPKEKVKNLDTSAWSIPSEIKQ